MSVPSPIRRTKIICTLGPASCHPEILQAMIQAGMDVARLNLSHGTHASHTETIGILRELAADLDQPIAIMADLQGPKLRMGRMQDGGVMLRPEDILTFDLEPQVGNAQRVPVQSPEVFRLIHEGSTLLVDDGLMEFRVAAVQDTKARMQVIHGGLLKDNKGINILHASINISALTDKDRADLAFAVAQDVDWIALSFVQTPQNIQEVKELIRFHQGEHTVPIPVVAKIEKPSALECLDEIMELADGIMVARGDLGIEMRTEQVPLIQKDLIQRCNARGIPVITATQMLESMIANVRPTRAEASDVANAVIDGTDSLMLSGETAIGQDPVRVVQTMATIVRATEAGLSRPVLNMDAGLYGDHPIAVSIAKSSVDVATQVGAHAILAPTASGFTARRLASFRPPVPVLALTPDQRVQRQLSLYRGIYGIATANFHTADEVHQDAIDRALRSGLVAEGDHVVITSGSIIGLAGTTNMMTVRRVIRPMVTGKGVGQARRQGLCLRYGLDPLPSGTKLEDYILFLQGDVDSALVHISQCVGFITTRPQEEIEEQLPWLHRAEVAAIYEAHGDLDALVSGQSLILDAVSGRVFDYASFTFT